MTFQALVDALLPTVNSVGNELTYNANDLNVHEYLVDGFNNYITIQKQLKQQTISLAQPIVSVLSVRYYLQ